MKDFMAAASVYTFYGMSVAGWIVAILHDLDEKEFGWLLIDLLASPVGAVRGVGLFFGWW